MEAKLLYLNENRKIVESVGVEVNDDFVFNFDEKNFVIALFLDGKMSTSTKLTTLEQYACSTRDKTFFNEPNDFSSPGRALIIPKELFFLVDSPDGCCNLQQVLEKSNTAHSHDIVLIQSEGSANGLSLSSNNLALSNLNGDEIGIRDDRGVMTLFFKSSNGSQGTLTNRHNRQVNLNMPRQSGEILVARDQQVAPLSSTTHGKLNEIVIMPDYLYVCVAPDTWKRVALSSW